MSGWEAQWHDINVELSNDDYGKYGFLTDETWLIMPNGGFVETGLFNGIFNDLATVSTSNPCNCLAYSTFWADYSTASGLVYEHWLSNLSPDNNNHVYEILNRGGTNYWDVYYDYVLQGTPNKQTYASASYGQAGLEYYDGTDEGNVTYYNQAGLGGDQNGHGIPDYDPNSAGYEQDFNNTATFTVEYYNGSSWYYPSALGSDYIDYGCNAFPQSYCLNASNPVSYEWSEYKP